MVMEVAADKRNLDDTLINVSIITITTSNHKDFESALYELVKFPIVLNWTNSEEGFSTTVIHFPKRLNQSEERKLVSFLKVLRRKVKFEWNIEVAKIPQDDDFWIYSDLLNYIKRNYREYYEVQNICEFNEPTAVRITKLVLQITEKKQIGETTVYRWKWSIYEAEVAAGHRPIFIIAPAMSKVESGWHYLKRVDDHEIFRKPPDLDHTGVQEIAQRVGINLNKLDKPVWATLVELHSKHPIFFELTYPVPLKEVFKLRDVKEVINDAITSGGILDSVVQFITPAFLISALPEFVSPSVMRYNPHGFIITNTKIGKSSIAEKLGQRIERPTIAGLIGFSDAKEVNEGFLHKKSDTVFIDEIEENKKEDPSVANGLLTLMENGDVILPRGKGVECNTTSTIIFLGNLENNALEGELYYINAFKTMLDKIHKNTEALGSRIGLILFGDDLKPFESVGLFDEGLQKKYQAVLQTIKRILSLIYSRLLNTQEVVNWLNNKLPEYATKLDELAATIFERDSSVAKFIIGHKEAYRHIRGLALRLAIIEVADEIFNELRKYQPSILDDLDELYDEVLEPFVGKITQIAEEKLKTVLNINLQSLNKMVSIIQRDDYVSSKLELDYESLPKYAQKFILALGDYCGETGRDVTTLEALKDYLKPYLDKDSGFYRDVNKILAPVIKNKDKINRKLDFVEIFELNGVYFIRVSMDKIKVLMDKVMDKNGYNENPLESSNPGNEASTNFSKNEMDIMDEMDIGMDNAMDDEVRGMDTSGEGSTSISSISSIRNSNQGSAPSKSKNIGDRQSFGGGYVSTDISIESSKVDNLPENIRIQGLIEIWQECLASSSSKHNAVTTFWELAKSQYRSEDLCRADILNHFEEIGLPQWFKRELGVKTTLQDVLGKKLGWG